MKRAMLAPISFLHSGKECGSGRVLTSAALAVLLGLVFAPASGAMAQDSDMDFTAGGADESGDASGGEGDADMDFSSGSDEPEEAPIEGDILEQLAAEESSMEAESGDSPERTIEASEEIFAVQQIYALRINRVELSPNASFTLNDPFVSHPAIGLGLNYWWTNVLALGASFSWYEGLESESDLNFNVRRSTRLAVPVSAYQFGAHLNFTYVPLYGKFAMFNEFIFQWDSYIVGGVGMLRTRPVPVVDPEIRHFDYDFRVAFNLGLGIRVFLSRWLAVYGEIRDYVYLEQLEALNVGLGEQRLDEATWTQSDSAITNNVSVHLGLTIFLPFDFDYNLPR